VDEVQTGRATEGNVGPRRRKKAPRTPGAMTATGPDHIWALDFVFDETVEGRPIKV
jgi:hypothetical protein